MSWQVTRATSDQAQRINEAFRDAERCAVALNECLTGARSFDQAMIDYQQDRDAKMLPMYEFTRHSPPPDAADFGDAKVISKFGVPDDLSYCLRRESSLKSPWR